MPQKKRCKICLTKTYGIVKFSCMHRICLGCIDKLTQQKCPFCRKDLQSEIPLKEDNPINQLIRTAEEHQISFEIGIIFGL